MHQNRHRRSLVIFVADEGIAGNSATKINLPVSSQKDSRFASHFFWAEEIVLLGASKSRAIFPGAVNIAATTAENRAILVHSVSDKSIDFIPPKHTKRTEKMVGNGWKSKETAFDQNCKSFNSWSTECWIICSGDPELVNWAIFCNAFGGSPKIKPSAGVNWITSVHPSAVWSDNSNLACATTKHSNFFLLESGKLSCAYSTDISSRTRKTLLPDTLLSS